MYGGTSLCADLISPAVDHVPDMGGEYSKKESAGQVQRKSKKTS